MSEDLATWLLEQLTEDKRIARDEVERRRRWQVELADKHQRGEVPGLIVLEYDDPGAPGDPDRVLAECDAKRQIIQLAKERKPSARAATAATATTSRRCCRPSRCPTPTAPATARSGDPTRRARHP